MVKKVRLETKKVYFMVKKQHRHPIQARQHNALALAVWLLARVS